MDTEAVLRLLQDVAEEVVNPRFRSLSSGEIDEKGPGDLVTAADREAEVLITAALRAAYPDAMILGEETYAGKHALMQEFWEADHAFTVDPVDGTKNFVHGSRDHAVMVGEVKGGEAVRGWIWQPQHETAYVAELGGGAWRNGERVLRPPTPPRVGVARRHLAPEVARPGARRRPPAAGADLGLVRDRLPHLAEGDADYVVYGRANPWDHVPGGLILTEAGGFLGTVRRRRRTGRPTTTTSTAPRRARWSRRPTGRRTTRSGRWSEALAGCQATSRASSLRSRSELSGHLASKLARSRSGRSAATPSRRSVLDSTWIVTPSPRSMVAPGISWTAMPGRRSSAGRPGWTTTVPLVEPRSVTTAEPWSAPVPGRISRWVEEISWCGLGTVTSRVCSSSPYATGIGRAADHDGAVDVDDLAAGEDQPGDAVLAGAGGSSYPGVTARSGLVSGSNSEPPSGPGTGTGAPGIGATGGGMGAWGVGSGVGSAVGSAVGGGCSWGSGGRIRAGRRLGSGVGGAARRVRRRPRRRAVVTAPARAGCSTLATRTSPGPTVYGAPVAVGDADAQAGHAARRSARPRWCPRTRTP